MSWGRSKKPHNYYGSKKGIARCPYCLTKRHLVVSANERHSRLKDTIHKEDGTIEFVYDRNFKRCTIYCSSRQSDLNKPGGKGCGRSIMRYARNARKAKKLCIQAWNDPYGEI